MNTPTRLLRRAIAREMHRLLTQQCDIDDYRDLRPARQAKNITLTNAANHFGVWLTVISRLERGLQRDDSLATKYRQWLNAASCPLGRDRSITGRPTNWGKRSDLNLFDPRDIPLASAQHQPTAVQEVRGLWRPFVAVDANIVD